MALSRTFGLSRRQAYRYLELARAGTPAPSAAENSVTITVKMPESLALGLRDSQRVMNVSDGITAKLRVSRCRFPNLCAAGLDIVKLRVNRAGCSPGASESF